MVRPICPICDNSVTVAGHGSRTDLIAAARPAREPLIAPRHDKIVIQRFT